MSRATVARHYERILQAWPKDLLRPVQFQKILQKRLENQASESVADPSSTRSTPKQTAFSEGAELRQVNALYSLLDNRYSKQYPVSPKMMNPLSNPTYYSDLAAELEEVPKLSFWGRIMKSLKRRIRFS